MGSNLQSREDVILEAFNDSMFVSLTCGGSGCTISFQPIQPNIVLQLPGDCQASITARTLHQVRERGRTFHFQQKDDEWKEINGRLVSPVIECFPEDVEFIDPVVLAMPLPHLHTSRESCVLVKEAGLESWTPVQAAVQVGPDMVYIPMNHFCSLGIGSIGTEPPICHGFRYHVEFWVKKVEPPNREFDHSVCMMVQLDRCRVCEVDLRQMQDELKKKGYGLSDAVSIIAVDSSELWLQGQDDQSDIGKDNKLMAPQKIRLHRTHQVQDVRFEAKILEESVLRGVIYVQSSTASPRSRSS